MDVLCDLEASINPTNAARSAAGSTRSRFELGEGAQELREYDDQENQKEGDGPVYYPGSRRSIGQRRGGNHDAQRSARYQSESHDGTKASRSLPKKRPQAKGDVHEGPPCHNEPTEHRDQPVFRNSGIGVTSSRLIGGASAASVGESAHAVRLALIDQPRRLGASR